MGRCHRAQTETPLTYYSWMGLAFLALVALIGLRVAMTTPSRGSHIRPPKRKWK